MVGNLPAASLATNYSTLQTETHKCLIFLGVFTRHCITLWCKTTFRGTFCGTFWRIEMYLPKVRGRPLEVEIVSAFMFGVEVTSVHVYIYLGPVLFVLTRKRWA